MDILCFRFRETIIEGVFQIVVTLHVLYIVSFGTKLEVLVNLTDWGVQFLIDFKLVKYSSVNFMELKGTAQSFFPTTAPKKSPPSSKWLNGSNVWIQEGQNYMWEILHASLSRLTHCVWCLWLQFLHCRYMLKDCTFLCHVLHILFESTMMQIYTYPKFMDTWHVEYKLAYC